MVRVESRVFSLLLVAVGIVASLAGFAAAAGDAPAPSPTSGAVALSSPLVGALLCPAVALLFGSLRR
ncbi:Arabinogalactan peptide 3 [Ananas comosus]|uniref:Arabinogalactan peptide 3 n=2 Tax=Ananas comosus TaxID=4615 RepID=A0A199UQC1_ANACO|nr:Arabinogalactan peptide 3 [Ananas comosus]